MDIALKFTHAEHLMAKMQECNETANLKQGQYFEIYIDIYMYIYTTNEVRCAL